MTADRATRSAIRMGETNRCRWSHDHFQAWNDTSVRLVFRSLPLHRLQSCAAGGRQVVGHCPPVCPRHQASWNPLSSELESPSPSKQTIASGKRTARTPRGRAHSHANHTPQNHFPSRPSPRADPASVLSIGGVTAWEMPNVQPGVPESGTGHDRRVPETGARGEGRRDRRADCRSVGVGWPVASAGPAAIVRSFRTWAVGEAQI